MQATSLRMTKNSTASLLNSQSMASYCNKTYHSKFNLAKAKITCHSNSLPSIGNYFQSKNIVIGNDEILYFLIGKSMENKERTMLKMK